MEFLYWNKRYLNDENLPKENSSFSSFTLSHIDKNTLIFDVGCGNGRDSKFFAEQGLKTVGIDQVASPSWITDHVNLSYLVSDFTKFDYTLSNLFDYDICIYSRFSLHAIDYEEEKVFFESLSSLPSGSTIFIECRTIKDQLYGEGKNVGKHEYITDHYRRFIDPVELTNKLDDHFDVLYKEESHGWSKLGNEDPHLLRVILKK